MTSELLWVSGLVAATLDAALMVVAARVVSPELFRQLKWYLVGAAAVTHAALWGVFGSVLFWESVYRPLFPGWSPWVLPLVFGTLEGLAALGFWWISAKAARWQAALFVILSGPWSVATHGIAVWRGLLDVPVLKGVSVSAALVFAFFEYIFYGCVAVGIAGAGYTLCTGVGFSRRHGETRWL